MSSGPSNEQMRMPPGCYTYEESPLAQDTTQSNPTKEARDETRPQPFNSVCFTADSIRSYSLRGRTDGARERGREGVASVRSISIRWLVGVGNLPSWFVRARACACGLCQRGRKGTRDEGARRFLSSAHPPPSLVLSSPSSFTHFASHHLYCTCNDV
ncbi:hypothetical protein BDW22DRAFT_1153570 [Trametopsis cervina]|nr:hypothetical protein BDW22DRAFT_1153570 [Trametopsis cervina]